MSDTGVPDRAQGVKWVSEGTDGYSLNLMGRKVRYDKGSGLLQRVKVRGIGLKRKKLGVWKKVGEGAKWSEESREWHGTRHRMRFLVDSLKFFRKFATTQRRNTSKCWEKGGNRFVDGFLISSLVLLRPLFSGAAGVSAR
ncbi:hypothetical protein Dimus_025930 [Dionaea muscipula]